MIGISIANSIGYYRGGQGYSEEYQAVLDAGIGTAPSDAQKAKQNTLIQSLKTAGIWDLLDVFYVFATDGDSDFATINWKNPSQFQCTKVNTPTFTANQGFNGNGSSSYLNTNWNISTNAVNYTQNNASAGIWCYNTITAGNKRAFGCDLIATSGQGVAIGPYHTSNFYSSKINSLNYSSTALAPVTGLFTVRRNNSSNYDAHVNGALLANYAITSGTRPSLTPFIGAVNSGSGAVTLFDGIISMAFTGAYFDPADMHTAFNTYLTSL